MAEAKMFDVLKRTAIGGALAFLIYVVLKRLSETKSIGDKKNEKAKDTPFLDKKLKKPIKLVKRVDLSHDTALLQFSLDESDRVLGLPVGKHFKLVMPNLTGVEAGKWNGRVDAEHGKPVVTRSYTPTSGNEKLGYVDLLTKFYLPGVKEQFPDGGKVSRQLNDLKVGDEIMIQGPFGRIEYKGKGAFKIGSKITQVSEVGMMAGGSGITPILQIIRYALINPDDRTRFSLIYANKTEADILVREELENYEKQHPDRFHLHFTVDGASAGWKYSRGHISDIMISNHLPAPSDDVLILMCGPPPMVRFACRANLDKLGYPKSSQVEF